MAWTKQRRWRNPRSNKLSTNLTPINPVAPVIRMGVVRSYYLSFLFHPAFFNASLLSEEFSC